jgi:hypothetical protein
MFEKNAWKGIMGIKNNEKLLVFLLQSGVSVVVRLRRGNSAFISSGAKRFFSSSKTPDRTCVPQSLLFSNYSG